MSLVFSVFFISIFRIREYIINAIPRNLKLAISAGVGLFLGIIALEESKIVVASPATLVTLGDLRNPAAVLCLLGLVSVERDRLVGLVVSRAGFSIELDRLKNVEHDLSTIKNK